MPISKPFVIATEGATTDGRQISRDWINQMAEQYDPKAYTALGNLEHYISAMPDSTFSAHGKVLQLSTRETEILGQKKLQLAAIFDANDAIVAYQKGGKKLFCSIEINPNFAQTGKAYLTGLAFTDSPASLGTEVMEFASKANVNPFTSRKKAEGNLFSAAEEVSLEWEPDTASASAGENLFNKVKDLLGLGKKDADERFADQAKAVEVIALSQKTSLETLARLETETAALSESVKLAVQAVEAGRAEFAAFKTIIDKTPDDTAGRPAATGGNGQNKTDC